MQNKKGFTLIELMIVVAIVAILAMIAVPMYQKYIERSRNTAAQNLLQQVALAELAVQTDAVSSTATGALPGGYLKITSASGDDLIRVQKLMDFGFRPDPNVGFRVELPTIDDGFVAYACHVAKKSKMYVYDNVAAGGVKEHNTTITTYAGTPVPATLFVFYMDTGTSVATLGTGHKTLNIVNGKSNGF